MEKSSAVTDTAILELIDPELLDNRVQRKSAARVGLSKLKRIVTKPIRGVLSTSSKDSKDDESTSMESKE